MPLFRYEATDKEGKQVRGEISASEQRDVLSFLASQNLTPILIKPIKEKTPRGERVFFFFQKITILDKADFCVRLSALLKAGISIMRSLDILEMGAQKPILRKFFSDIRSGVEKGRPLYQVLEEKYKNYFARHFIGLIKAGEESGTLDTILEELSNDLRKEYNLKKKIQSSSFYPAILMVGAILVIIFLITFIIPRLVSAFYQAGVKLPSITLAMIVVANFFQNNFLLILSFLFIILGFSLLFKQTKKGEMFFANLFLSLPLFGDLSKKVILSRFCRTLSMLLRSGLTFSEALEIVSEAVGNPCYKQLILESKNLVIRGISFSSCIKNYPKYFPSMLVETIGVGEEAGKLEDMLSTMSNFYEEEASRRADTLVMTIEPVLLIIMGMIVFFIALSVILPIYQFISAF